MLLINIEMLSDSELRYIASQEEIDGFGSLSREDLIAELEELYGDDGPENKTAQLSSSKFSKSLTDIVSDCSLQLPGTEMLPECYNETSVHAVACDMNWAYVFWSISEQKMTELSEGISFKLRTRALKDGSNQEFFDIDVSENDRCWNIELPWTDCSYTVQLIAFRGESEEVLCESNTVTTASSAVNNSESFSLSDERNFRLLVEPLVSVSGHLVSCRQVSEIITKDRNRGL